MFRMNLSPGHLGAKMPSSCYWRRTKKCQARELLSPHLELSCSCNLSAQRRRPEDQNKTKHDKTERSAMSYRSKLYLKPHRQPGVCFISPESAIVNQLELGLWLCAQCPN